MKTLVVSLAIALAAVSAEAQRRSERTWPKLDPNKKTVCTVTMNSTQEKELFQQYLKEFNFVELTHESTQDWFGAACKQGIKCDVLLFSGHFGGSFFGSEDYKLSLEALEDFSCRKDCDGILKNPKEVFLFGCNTMAGKGQDHRTIEEYVEALMEEGFTRGQAQQTAAFRYSEMGSSFRERMTGVFAGVKKIYGFYSLAPLGEQIAPGLENYLKWVGPYGKHLDTLGDAKNEKLFKSLDGMTLIERPGASLALRDRAPVCVLNNPAEELTTKATWIRDVMNDAKKRLEYAPMINFFLSKMKRDGVSFGPAEKALMDEVAANTEARKAIEGFLAKPNPGLLAMQVSMAGLAYKLGWWDAATFRAGLNRVMGGIFKSDLDREARDTICSLDTELDIPLEILPRRPWGSDTVRAIECMKPADPAIQLALLEMIMSGSGSERRMATAALRAAQPTSMKVLRPLVDLLSSENRGTQRAAAEVIENTKITDPILREKVRKYDPDLLEERRR